MQHDAAIPESNAAIPPEARVLIVDNEPDGASSLAMFLKLRGFQTEIITDSSHALARVDAFRPDAILLDIAMPQVSGYELAKQIRARPALDHVPIIVVSGYADKPHIARSMESGCDHHLVKPVDLATMETTLSQAIQQRSQFYRDQQPTDGSPGNESNVYPH